MKCFRCGTRYAIENEYGLCPNCLRSFKPMVNELRLAFIHHYMHPEKKTIYVHDIKSKRYVKHNVKGEKNMDKKFVKESREIYANKMKNITEKNPVIRSKIANQYWTEHLRRIEVN